MNQFSRTEKIIGEENQKKLRTKKVAIFGLGGVGSFVLEALARVGIGEFLLVDKDTIDITNINRQLLALHSTIGKDKVELAKQRVLDICPDTKVETKKMHYTGEEEIIDTTFSYIIDAIDTVSSKIALIETAKKLKVPIISCMGTGNKLNPSKLEIEDISKTNICPLAKVMRKELKKRGIENVKVLYSQEEPYKYQEEKQVIGSVSFVPSVAGLMMAAEVVKDLIS